MKEGVLKITINNTLKSDFTKDNHYTGGAGSKPYSGSISTDPRRDIPNKERQESNDPSQIVSKILDKGWFFQLKNDRIFRHDKDQVGIHLTSLSLENKVLQLSPKEFQTSFKRVPTEKEVGNFLIDRFIKRNEKTSNTFYGLRVEEFDSFEITFDGPDFNLMGKKGDLIICLCLKGDWMQPDIFVTNAISTSRHIKSKTDTVDFNFKLPESMLNDYFKEIRKVTFQFISRRSKKDGAES